MGTRATHNKQDHGQLAVEVGLAGVGRVRRRSGGRIGRGGAREAVGQCSGSREEVHSLLTPSSSTLAIREADEREEASAGCSLSLALFSCAPLAKNLLLAVLVKDQGLR